MASAEMFGGAGVMFATMRKGSRVAVLKEFITQKSGILRRWVWDIGEFD
jgi:hypothetical protein